MNNKKTLILLSIFLTGCNSNPSSQVKYKQEDIKSSGIYEARVYLMDEECPAFLDAEWKKENAAHESALLGTIGIIIGKKIIDGGVKYVAKNLKTYGDSMSSPFTMPTFIVADDTQLENAKCLVLGYGEFGGEGGNNITGNVSLPWSLYKSTKIEQDLTGNLGFAMQIGLQKEEGGYYFIPYNLFYPARLRPYGVNTHHSIIIHIDFKETKLAMEFPDVKQNTYLTYKAVKSHAVFIAKDKFSPDNMTISITEGPDSEILGTLLSSVGSDDTATQVSNSVQNKIDKSAAGDKN